MAAFVVPFRYALTLLALSVAHAAAAAPEIEFASVEAAREALGARDAFVERLSPFDRTARLDVGRDVPESQYLEFAEQAAREWTREERERLGAAFAAIEPALSGLLPEIEEPILLIKTSGAEEAGAGYTRGHAVIVPEHSAARPERALQRLLAHEIFHLVSRSRPELRRALYGTIGFRYCGEVELPDSLASRRITNPDAPINDHCIRLRVDGDEAWAVPVLLSQEPRYDPEAGMELLEYMTFVMLLVDGPDAEGPARPIERGGGPVLVSMNDVEGFYEQVGRNTDYIIHPEEILASNFVLLVQGLEEVPSPGVLERMRGELSAAREAAQ